MRPDEICLVAAHNGDLPAARNCGLRKGFVLRLTEHGLQQDIDPKPDRHWDIVAKDLAELGEILGTWPAEREAFQTENS
jgi:2-haloacid dehalogenase